MANSWGYALQGFSQNFKPQDILMAKYMLEQQKATQKANEASAKIDSLNKYALTMASLGMPDQAMSLMGTANNISNFKSGTYMPETYGTATGDEQGLGPALTGTQAYYTNRMGKAPKGSFTSGLNEVADNAMSNAVKDVAEQKKAENDVAQEEHAFDVEQKKEKVKTQQAQDIADEIVNHYVSNDSFDEQTFNEKVLNDPEAIKMLKENGVSIGKLKNAMAKKKNEIAQYQLKLASKKKAEAEAAIMEQFK